MRRVYGTRERCDRLAERPGSAWWLAEAGVAAREASTWSVGCATDEWVSDGARELASRRSHSCIWPAMSWGWRPLVASSAARIVRVRGEPHTVVQALLRISPRSLRSRRRG